MLRISAAACVLAVHSGDGGPMPHTCAGLRKDEHASSFDRLEGFQLKMLVTTLK